MTQAGAQTDMLKATPKRGLAWSSLKHDANRYFAEAEDAGLLALEARFTRPPFFRGINERRSKKKQEKERKGKERKELMDEFDVRVAKNGK